jgi:phage shock protein PspC (stress-responsive transcriptional regulator)
MRSPPGPQHPGAMNTAQDTTQATNPDSTQPPTQQAEPRPLYRPVHDRMLAGVASGLARYFDVDVTLIRIVLVVLTVVGGAGIPLYLAGWLLIPEEGERQSIAARFIDSR